MAPSVKSGMSRRTKRRYEQANGSLSRPPWSRARRRLVRHRAPRCLSRCNHPHPTQNPVSTLNFQAHVHGRHFRCDGQDLDVLLARPAARLEAIVREREGPCGVGHGAVVRRRRREHVGALAIDGCVREISKAMRGATRGAIGHGTHACCAAPPATLPCCHEWAAAACPSRGTQPTRSCR